MAIAIGLRYKQEILHYEGGEALEQVVQRSCGCPLPGSVQGQAGWGFEQPGVVEGDLKDHLVPTPCHGFQPKPFFDTVIISDVTVLSTEPTFTPVFPYDSVLVGVAGILSK